MGTSSGNSNSGLVVSDSGSFSAEVVAVGKQATATKSVQSASASEALALETLREHLKELTSLIQQYGDQVHPEAKAAVGQVVEEAAKPKPNKLVMSSILQGAAAAVGSIAALGTSILKIKDLVSAL